MSVILGQNDLATTHPELAAEWHPTKNGDLTPQMVSRGSEKKVWWQCEHGHEWQAAIYSRVSGNRCPICSGRMVLSGYNDLATTHPELATQWHPVKNNRLTPQAVTANSHKKAWWLGSCGHEWEAAVADRSRGKGCPVCVSKKIVPGVNDLTTTHPEVAAQWHPFRNGDITPQMVAPQSNKKAWWQCDKGHEWKTAISHRVKGKGCPICNGIKLLPGFNDLVTTNPDLAAQWHPTLNRNLTPDKVMAGSEKKVWWKCDCGHEWESLCYSRLRGDKCPICSGRKVVTGINDLATVNPMLASQWHPEKNRDLTPQQVTAGSNRKVWWLGTCGHEWEAVVCSRSSGCGCPICDYKNKTSFPEKAVLFYLSKCFQDATGTYHSDWLGRMELDIYIPSLQVAVEYDGQAWHQNLEKDLVKNALCSKNGIRLIRIREEGCPEIPGECIIRRAITSEALNTAIKTLFENYLYQEISFEIDTDRDRDEIMRLITSTESE